MSKTSQAKKKVLPASAKILNRCNTLGVVKKQISELQEQEVLLKAEIQKYMSTEELLYDRKVMEVIATWIRGESTRFDEQAFKKNHPVMHKRFMRTKPRRTFLLK